VLVDNWECLDMEEGEFRAIQARAKSGTVRECPTPDCAFCQTIHDRKALIAEVEHLHSMALGALNDLQYPDG